MLYFITNEVGWLPLSSSCQLPSPSGYGPLSGHFTTAVWPFGSLLQGRIHRLLRPVRNSCRDLAFGRSEGSLARMASCGCCFSRYALWVYNWWTTRSVLLMLSLSMLQIVGGLIAALILFLRFTRPSEEEQARQTADKSFQLQEERFRYEQRRDMMHDLERRPDDY
jgi:hypothetical protein